MTGRIIARALETRDLVVASHCGGELSSLVQVSVEVSSMPVHQLVEGWHGQNHL